MTKQTEAAEAMARIHQDGEKLCGELAEVIDGKPLVVVGIALAGMVTALAFDISKQIGGTPRGNAKIFMDNVFNNIDHKGH
jgi:hypothetical protein